MNYKGQYGLWFPANTARLMLKDIKELDIVREKASELQLHIDKLNTKIEIKEERFLILTENKKLSDKKAEMANEAFGNCTKSLDRLEEKQTKWYRHPAFFVGLGVVLTVALQIATAEILQTI